MTIRQSVEPSAELRGLYIELTDFLGRLEAIVEPVVPKMKRVHQLLCAELPDDGDELFMADAGETAMIEALTRVCDLLGELVPGCTLP